MARAENTQLIDRFQSFYREYYKDEIGTLARQYPTGQKSLFVDWQDLYQFDPDLADDVRSQPGQLREYAEEALRLYDLPVEVSLSQAHVRIRGLPDTTEIREIRADHRGRLIAVQGIVRKATDVRPKITNAAFECQRCGTLTRIPQTGGDFQEPHECQGCERQGPFRINFDQSTFIDAQKIRVQESPEGLRGGETPQAIDISIEDDVTGEVTAGDHVTVTGILNLDQQGNDREQSPMFDVFMEGMTVEVEDEQFEEMDITDDEKARIVELSNDPDIYEKMVGAIAPSIYGYDDQKLAMILQLFSGVTKHLPDGSRIRGDLHMLLIGDPGTGKSQLLQYIRHIAPRSVYTSGKGSSSAGLTAAAVRDDFGDGQQWTLEAGALVLADQGIAAIDELDKMRCVTGDTFVHLGDGRIERIGELAGEASQSGTVEALPNGRTIRNVDLEAWTMTDAGDVVRRPISAIHEYEAPDTLTDVRLETGESITTTDDHPCIVLEDGDRVERPASELEAGDWMFVPRSLPRPAADGGVTARGPAGGGAGDADVSPALASVLGYLSGDGNVFYDRSEGTYGIRFTNAEEALLADFERACRQAFDASPIRAPSEQRADGVETVRLVGKEYADAVLAGGMNLETYDGKSFPTAVSEGSMAAKAAFARALADSEGSVDVVTGNVRIFSASYRLLLGLKHLLLEFGVSSQIQTEERTSKLDVHRLMITDADSLQAFREHVDFTLARKRSALEEICADASGDRTILDVVPDIGPQLHSTRTSLRLNQSECGINPATYCNFENGDANVSLRLGHQILDAFESRKRQAEVDVETLSERTEWETLTRMKDRYHVSQAEIATETPFSQQAVSASWGQSEVLRRTVRRRLSEIVSAAAETDLSDLRTLVRGDVKWRRVERVEPATPGGDDDRIPILRGELADTLSCSVRGAEACARELLDEEPQADTWSGLRSELERHEISLTDVAECLDVSPSTVSRWFNGVVATDTFDDVKSIGLDLIRERRANVRKALNEIEARSNPRVYDLTVEGTHNFVANGMVVHNSEDRSALHEALEQQQISISKAGINATLKARCSLLGAANPKYGRFDQYEPIAEQIDLEPALISRFDLIFTVTDKPDAEKDANLADHIIKTNYAGELNTHREEITASNHAAEEVEAATSSVAPTIDPEFLRKYIAYSKRTCFPTMTEDAKATIRDFYVDLRARGADEDAPVPVTARKLEALVRLAEASARVRLSDTVEVEDAERATDIVLSCLKEIGMDPETGQFDADVIETGTSKSQRDRIKSIKALIEDIEDEYDEGAPVDVVIERAEEAGMEAETAEHEIEQLKQKGEVYEPRTDHLRTT